MSINTKLTLFICFVLTSSIVCLHADEKQAPESAPEPPAKALLSGPDSGVNQAHADFMKKVSENSAKMLELKKDMDERREELYSKNTEIKKLWSEMAEMQKEINAILEADKEYMDLVLRRDILSSILPETAAQPFRGAMPPMFK